MAIFNQIPDSDLGTKYTHYGLIHGWVPALFGDMDSDAPLVAVENWMPDWTRTWGPGFSLPLTCWQRFSGLVTKARAGSWL